MSSTHKISALRSLANKVALGLGIALVASSIAPMVVAPASATGAPSGDQIRYPYSNSGPNNYVAQRNASDGSNVLYSPSNGLSSAGQIPTNAKQTVGVGDLIYTISGSDKFITKATSGGSSISNTWADLTASCATSISSIAAVQAAGENHLFASCGTKIVSVVDPISSNAQFPGSLTYTATVKSVAAIRSSSTDYIYFNVENAGIDTYAYTSNGAGSSLASPVKVSHIDSFNCGNSCTNAPIAIKEDGAGEGTVVIVAGAWMRTLSGAVALAQAPTLVVGGTGATMSVGTQAISAGQSIKQLFALNQSGSQGRIYATLDEALTYTHRLVDLSTKALGSAIANVPTGSSTVWFVLQTADTNNWSGTAPTYTYVPQAPASHTLTFNPNGGVGSNIVVTGTNGTAPTVSHSLNTCTLLGWGSPSTSTIPLFPAGSNISVYLGLMDATYYAIWSSASCRVSQQQPSTADARPTPQLDLSGLSVIPAPAVGATAGTAGIDLKGKNLPTVASVTVAGKDGKVVTSTETALKLELPTLAPGSYDIVMKTEGNGSITIQNGLVIAAPAPKVDPTPIPPVVISPSIPRTTLVAATTPVPGFLPGKAGVSEAQKAIIQDVVLTKNVTSLECVGVTNAKVSAKLASARAAAICSAAKAQNADLTTSVKTIAEAKVNGPIGSVLINYNH